jgi:hypothetical protein
MRSYTLSTSQLQVNSAPYRSVAHHEVGPLPTIANRCTLHSRPPAGFGSMVRWTHLRATLRAALWMTVLC